MANSPTLQEWTDRARSIQPETRAFIGGKYVEARDAATLPCISPIDGSAIADIAACGSADIDGLCAQRAVRSNAAVGPVWRRVSASRCYCDSQD